MLILIESFVNTSVESTNNIGRAKEKTKRKRDAFWASLICNVLIKRTTFKINCLSFVILIQI